MITVDFIGGNTFIITDGDKTICSIVPVRTIVNGETIIKWKNQKNNIEYDSMEQIIKSLEKKENV
jgi:hypothetical protein